MKGLLLIAALLMFMPAKAGELSENKGKKLELQCGSLSMTLETVCDKGGWISMLEAEDGIKAKTPLPLFEVALRHKDGTKDTLRSNAGWNEAGFRKAGNHRYVFSFSGNRTLKGEDLSLEIILKECVETDKAKGEIPSLCLSWGECWIPEIWALENATLLPLSFGPLPQDTRFFYPYSSGIEHNTSRYNLERYIRYPSGFGASMGWFSLYGKNGGIYYAAHDAEATIKDLFMNGKAGQGLDFRFDYPATTASDYSMTFASANIVLAPLHGDWVDGAKIYRDWVRAEASWFPRDKMGPNGRTDTPLWMKELSVWAQGGPDGVTQFQSALGVPIGFHWYNWHAIPFDNDYPHYFPTRPGFQEQVQRLQERNVYVMPYINGRLWDTRDNGMKDSLFTAQALPAVTKFLSGEPITETYGSKEADGTDVLLGVMCPKTETWRNKMRETVLKLCGGKADGGYGVKAVYMDQVAAAPAKECFDSAHGHPLGGGTWWTPAYRELLDRIRHQKPSDAALTTESNADGYISSFDAYLVWQFQHDGQVPAFGFVYGGSIQLFGRGYGDPEPIAAKMKMAQSFVWGEQLGWLSPSVMHDSKLFPFLRELVWTRHHFRHYFYQGEMARSPRLSAANPTVQTRWYFCGTLFPVENPAVLSGAWTIPAQGKTLLMFANYTAKELSLDVQYAVGEWGYESDGYKVFRHDADGKCTEVEKLPESLVFAPETVFVIELERK